ncbi:protein ACCELERATED CELL DEATH 6 [Carica papaya]|uniref:protein ACCELERATED CELL DEATH 6 n=1 Tax=Carica papaya TaxID=3649 RepID=UPI000B8C9650|nr:protein ACCELERATED CELL DEATH 6 [Carica papaya]
MYSPLRKKKKLEQMPSRDFTQENVLPGVTTTIPSGSQGSSSKNQETKGAEYLQYLPLYKAVDNGDLEATKHFIDLHPNALTASLSADKETALHISVLAGHIKIVEELVKRMHPENLTVKNKDGATALIYAAIGGIVKIAEYLVTKNHQLLSAGNKYDQIPVVVASLYGHKDLVRYLYSVTPLEALAPERSNGAMLVTTCIINDDYDIALDLVQQYPRLAYAQDTDNDNALYVLAQKPSAFPSGTRLALWQQWLYSCKYLITFYANQSETTFLCICLYIFTVPALMNIYELKLRHIQAQKLLSCICKEISTLGEYEFEKSSVKQAVFKAVKHGIVELIVEMMKNYPDIIWCCDEQNRGIFLYATLQRQEKIFSLIYKLGAKKNSMATAWDNNHNNMLHQAAFLAPSSQLDCVSGAALQMQRELQWFKEVESIVQPKYKEMTNRSRKTPQALFTETHKKLVEHGEKWMKETAESFTVVAALIATIMFSAAFTAPGGYDNYGNPIYLHHNSFIVFIVSDALSLFASCTSLLMFLGILTSRYSEEDFLKSLPTKLIIGLSTLFFSIATMMVSFGVTVVILLQRRIIWVSFPIIVLGSLPVSLFAVLQFPLLVEIFYSTYGPGIFEKPKKCPFFSS